MPTFTLGWANSNAASPETKAALADVPDQDYFANDHLCNECAEEECEQPSSTTG